MKPAPFRYHRAESVADALAVLAGDEDVKPLAGGQSLLTLMNLRLARPDVLVDLGRLDELRRVFDDTDRLLVGALLTHRDLETHPVIASHHPLIPAMARHIGHVGIRHRGTLGGTLAHADPAAELPAAMVLLGARLQVESAARGARTIEAADFFVSHFVSVLEPDEMITWVEIADVAPRTGWGFVEYAPRHGDYATAGAAALVRTDETGRPSSIRTALLSVAGHPVLLTGTADLPTGDDHGEWAAWAAPAVAELSPAADDPEYVKDLTVQAVATAAVAAVRRAEEREGEHG
ncbi:MAG: FAD binding domain-containing protein [Propionibacteriaceae bacterium]